MDMDIKDAWLKETCRELFNLAVKAEVEMTPAWSLVLFAPVVLQ